MLRIKHDSLRINKGYDSQFLNGRDALNNYHSIATVAGANDPQVSIKDLTPEEWAELYGFTLVD